MNEMEQNTSPVAASKGKTVFLFGILIVGALILAGLYFWSKNFKGESTDATTEALQEQSTSDELGSIEADLNATAIENIDGDFEAAASE